jgi:hypothetical protein
LCGAAKSRLPLEICQDVANSTHCAGFLSEP